ncbi:MAG: hypothetical protein ACXW2U_05315 [Telluria sp.]
MDQSKVTHQEQMISASSYASDLVGAMSLPLKLAIDSSSFAKLGPKNGSEAQSIYDGLLEHHGENLPELMATSLRIAWFSVALDIAWMKLFGSNPDAPRFVPDAPDEYVESKNWSWCLFQLLLVVHDLPGQVQEFLIPAREYVDFDWEDTMSCMALYFYARAAADAREGRVDGALNWVFEALEVRSLRDLSVTGREREQAEADDSIKNSSTQFAILGANAKHAENRAMKKSAFEWCDINMGKFSSFDSAAEAIAGKIIPVKFRTARRYITLWRKERSAGKL